MIYASFSLLKQNFSIILVAVDNRFLIYADTFLGWLHSVDMGGIQDVEEIHAAFIFRIEMCKMGEFLCIYTFMLRKITGEGWALVSRMCHRGSGPGNSCFVE
jgi:hypothetical protein